MKDLFIGSDASFAYSFSPSHGPTNVTDIARKIERCYSNRMRVFSVGPFGFLE
jgi:hypothetical protein